MASRSKSLLGKMWPKDRDRDRDQSKPPGSFSNKDMVPEQPRTNARASQQWNTVPQSSSQVTRGTSLMQRPFPKSLPTPLDGSVTSSILQQPPGSGTRSTVVAPAKRPGLAATGGGRSLTDPGVGSGGQRTRSEDTLGTPDEYTISPVSESPFEHDFADVSAFLKIDAEVPGDSVINPASRTSPATGADAIELPTEKYNIPVEMPNSSKTEMQESSEVEMPNSSMGSVVPPGDTRGSSGRLTPVSELDANRKISELDTHRKIISHSDVPHALRVPGPQSPQSDHMAREPSGQNPPAPQQSYQMSHAPAGQNAPVASPAPAPAAKPSMNFYHEDALDASTGQHQRDRQNALSPPLEASSGSQKPAPRGRESPHISFPPRQNAPSDSGRQQTMRTSRNQGTQSQQHHRQGVPAQPYTIHEDREQYVPPGGYPREDDVDYEGEGYGSVADYQEYYPEPTGNSAYSSQYQTPSARQHETYHQHQPRAGQPYFSQQRQNEQRQTNHQDQRQEYHQDQRQDYHQQQRQYTQQQETQQQQEQHQTKLTKRNNPRQVRDEIAAGSSSSDWPPNPFPGVPQSSTSNSMTRPSSISAPLGAMYITVAPEHEAPRQGKFMSFIKGPPITERDLIYSDEKDDKRIKDYLKNFTDVTRRLDRTDWLGTLLSVCAQQKSELASTSQALQHQELRTRDLSNKCAQRDTSIAELRATLRTRNDRISQLEAAAASTAREHAAQIHDMEVRAEQQVAALIATHKRELEAQRRTMQATIDAQHVRIASYSVGSYAVVSDKTFLLGFQTAAQKMGNLVSLVTRPDEVSVDFGSEWWRVLDPTDYLGRTRAMGPRSWPKFVRSVCWGVIVRGFFAYPLGFGVLGSEGPGFEALHQLYQVFARPSPDDPSGRRLILPNDKEVNNWRGSLFEAILKDVNAGGREKTFVAYFYANIEAVTRDLILTLQQLSNGRLDASAEPQAASIVQDLGTMALQMGSQRAHVVLESCRYGDQIVPGDKFKDDSGFASSSVVNVDLMTQPCVRRIGDGREDLTTSLVIVKGDVVTLK